jgi:putative transposase
MEGQEIDEVLARFDKKKTRSLRGYRQFVSDGIGVGRRDDLVGGGLKRSRLDREDNHEHEAYDERILGSGGFVETLTGADSRPEAKRAPLPLVAILQKVCDVTEMDAEKLKRSGKERAAAGARAIFCFLAVREYGHTGKEVGSLTGLGSSGVSIAVRRGEEVMRNNPSLRKMIVGADNKL